MRSYMTKIAPKIKTEDDLLNEDEEAETFSGHNIKLTPQSKGWAEEYRPATKLSNRINEGDLGAKELEEIEKN